MKIIFLSYSDTIGGACSVSFQIFKSLKKKLKFVKFFSIHKKKYDTIKINSLFYINLLKILEKIILLFFQKKYHQSLNIFRTYNNKIINRYKPDILNLHWFQRSSISLNEILNLKCKIIFSMHDMWMASGTQHYFEKNDINNFLEKNLYEIKKKIAKKPNVFFVVHNKWMESIAKKKLSIKKEKIFLCNYYPINKKIFKKLKKDYLRKKFNISNQSKVILFSAYNVDDERKGIKYFREIIEYFKNNNRYYFITVGNQNLKLGNKTYDNYQHFKFSEPRKLAEIYSLSDLYVCTSLLDNLPLTILESMSCGTPVLSFNNGGAKEILKKNGFIANRRNSRLLIDIIKNIKQKDLIVKSRRSIKFAQKYFSKEKVSERYKEIFCRVISK